MSETGTGRDLRYEWQSVALLTVAFGLVGVDRFALNILFPVMRHDLGLGYQSLGNAAAILSLSWGIASAMMGGVVDRRGVRAVLIPSVILFSLMAGLSGLAWGIGSLLLCRFLMGLAEGAFMPASISATLAAAAPGRKALIFGLQQNGLSVIGLGLGPIVIAALLGVTGSWRASFVIVAIPGLLVAWLLHRVIRDQPVAVKEDQGERPHWSGVLRYRNIIVGLGVMCCVVAALNIVIIMTPSYLVDVLHMSPAQMAVVTSASGAGALIGGVALPALSDRIGRKPVLLASALAALPALFFLRSSSDSVALFLEFAAISGLCFSVIYILVGPLASESVPPGLQSTASGLIVGVGEIVGGGLAPVAGGWSAERFGLSATYLLALGAMIVATVLILFLREPRLREPRRAEGISGKFDAS